jgi:hypothetical protein
MDKLSTKQRWLHEWYLRAWKDGLEYISLRIFFFFFF